jgi:hypothetical protein
MQDFVQGREETPELSLWEPAGKMALNALWCAEKLSWVFRVPVS